MERFVGTVAVVTGASSGIGKAIAKQLVKNKLIVIGLARRIDRFQNLAEELSADSKVHTGKFYPRQCDVCKPQEVAETFQWISSKIGPVSILINNAGILPRTSLFDVDEEVYGKCFDTNVKGLIMCTKEAIKSMMDTESGGHIVNINSVAGHKVVDFGGNDHLVYTASKYAVTALSEGLRREAITKNSNIKITSLSPGLVLTRMTADFVPMTGNDPTKMLRAKDIADACIAVLNTPPHVVISELTVQPLHPVAS